MVTDKPILIEVGKTDQVLNSIEQVLRPSDLGLCIQQVTEDEAGEKETKCRNVKALRDVFSRPVKPLDWANLQINFGKERSIVPKATYRQVSEKREYIISALGRGRIKSFRFRIRPIRTIDSAELGDRISIPWIFPRSFRYKGIASTARVPNVEVSGNRLHPRIAISKREFADEEIVLVDWDNNMNFRPFSAKTTVVFE